MAYKKNSSASFTGGSGQLAVMGEILNRKCNAAIPVVDVGTDVFAFQDDREEVARIQVKTAAGKRYRRGSGYSAKFGVSMSQLKRTDSPPLFYALAVRLNDGWSSFIVISRARLRELWNDGCGSENEKSDDLELHIQFRAESIANDDEVENKHELTATCGNFDLTNFINAWESLPPLKSLIAVGAPAGGTLAHARPEVIAQVQIDEFEPEPPQI